jgi:hypothetical protein
MAQTRSLFATTLGVTLSVLISSATVWATTHGQPLFPYEENSLTDDKLQQLIESNEVKEAAPLFAFDHGTGVLDPDRLKSGACKAYPGDAQWPPQSTWDMFDRMLGGALIKTVPLAAPCYRNLGVYDPNKCQAVRDSFFNQYTQ